jgi:iron complex transport system permease protein
MKSLAFAASTDPLRDHVILLLRWQLNLLALGEEAAATMGVRTRLVRTLMVVSATLITATCVSVSGVIGWIGLVVPHISRMMVGSDNRVSSACVGAHRGELSPYSSTTLRDVRRRRVFRSGY